MLWSQWQRIAKIACAGASIAASQRKHFAMKDICRTLTDSSRESKFTLVASVVAIVRLEKIVTARQSFARVTRSTQIAPLVVSGA
ncbi:hypothetical protein [Blastopirellula marina]|nr:hypothetical protein [Blastopirellula marina]